MSSKSRFLLDDPDLMLLSKNGARTPAADALRGYDYVLVYFSADWCPPCRACTPLLKAFYEDHHVKKNFMIVLVSLDHTDHELKSYFVHAHGDYLCVPFEVARPLAMRMSERYHFDALPTLLVFGNAGPTEEEGRLVAKCSRLQMERSLKEGKCPWQGTESGMSAAASSKL